MVHGHHPGRGHPQTLPGEIAGERDHLPRGPIVIGTLY